jgi:hypothetical protein
MARARRDDLTVAIILSAIAELIRAHAPETARAHVEAELSRRGQPRRAGRPRAMVCYLAHCVAGVPRKQIARVSDTHHEVVGEMIARIEAERDAATVDAEVDALEEAVRRMLDAAWTQAA